MTGKRSKQIVVYEPERGLVPGRARGAQDKVYGSYLQRLDPRNNPDVQAALAATPDPRFKEFFERLMSPQYKRISMQTIAKAVDISLADFNKWWQSESSQRAIAEAQIASVIITRDMAEDAKSQKIVCSRCDGLGFVAAPPGLIDDTPGYKLVALATDTEDEKYIRDCPNCDGIKKVRKPGDQHARDKILEMGGLVRKGPGITLVQNFGGASHPSAVAETADIVNLSQDAYDITTD